jgi:hypothetical protein
MATKELPSPDTLRQLLRYEPETGKLFWRERPESFFGTAHHCATWNTRYAGKETFVTNQNKGYKAGGVFDIRLLAHRVILAMVNDEWPAGDVDHINGIRSDNRLSNLRVVSRTVNMRNAKKPKTNTSGVIGVAWYAPRRKWRASIMVDKSSVHLGYFATMSAAVAAREAAERKYGFHENHGRSVNRAA